MRYDTTGILVAYGTFDFCLVNKSENGKIATNASNQSIANYVCIKVYTNVKKEKCNGKLLT